MFFRLLIIALCCLAGCSKQPNKAQLLRLNLYNEPPTLDSRKATDTTSMNVLLNLFEGLTRIGVDHQPHPAAAETIEISEDQLTYTFKLRECYWSNGERVTSDDFLCSWNKLLDPKFPSPFAYKHYVIKNGIGVKEGRLPLEELGVAAPDEQTLIVTLEHRAPYFLELLAFPTFFPVNKTIDDQYEDWSAEAGPLFVSNGPYLLDSWTHEDEIKLKKNPLYWDEGEVSLDEVHFLMIDDTMTEFYMYEMGELDWAGSPLSNLPTEILPALQKEGTLFTYSTSGVYFYKINTDTFLGNNLKIRRALGLAINRRMIVDHILQGDQMVATALVPPMPNWEQPNQYFRDGDLSKAQKLFQEGLDELGVTKEGLKPLVLSFNSNREHQKIAQAIQQQWKEGLGIRVELETLDWKVYLSKINKQNYEIARLGWLADYHDPLSFLEPYKFRDNPHIGGNNETGWEHPEYTSLLNAAERESDAHLRRELLRQAEKILVDEMPVIPLYYIINSYLKKPYVQDVYLSPLGTMDLKWAKVH